MKVNGVQILLDKRVFYSDTSVTGKLIVKAADPDWPKTIIIFIKFFDLLEIEWTEDEYTSNGATQSMYLNFQQPYRFNASLLLNNENVIKERSENNKEHIFSYPFEFELSQKLQSSIAIKHGKCQYFVKAFITDDLNVAKHYRNDVNIFEDVFRSFNHIYFKKEVIVMNETRMPSQIEDVDHMFDAKTAHIKILVTIPRLVYNRGEIVPIRLTIEHATDDGHRHKHSLSMHKICFKLVEVAKLTAMFPEPRVRITEHTICHTNRRHIHETSPHKIVLEENFPLPFILHSSSRKALDFEHHQHHLHPDVHHPKHYFTSSEVNQMNPIRIEYKLCLEFWKNFLKDELDISIPIAIDPEV